jgi:NADPH:quinone reductase-like Zn-dependent oxidoreductase
VNSLIVVASRSSHVPQELTMNAIRIHARGGPDQLVYEQVPKPMLAEGEVLVRVCAAGVTPTELSWDSTYTTRDGANRLPSIPGHELSGVIVATTAGANGLVEGEDVYGLLDFWSDGDFAEYVAARPEELAPKPRTVDHDHAAAAALSALTAWQALFDHGSLAKGQRVLIHGAAGGVGSFAVQLARWCGADVAATASKEDGDFVRGLGAACVIDYRAKRFENAVSNLDVVLDTFGGDTLRRSWGVVRPGGTVVTLVGAADAAEAAQRGVRGVSFIVKPNREELTEIAGLIDSGAVRVVLADVLPLSHAREAFNWGLNGHHRGKLVLRSR